MFLLKKLGNISGRTVFPLKQIVFYQEGRLRTFLRFGLGRYQVPIGQCGSRFGSGSRYRVLMTRKWRKKFTAEKKSVFFYQKLRSLQPSTENIQHFKTWKFFSFFYFCGSFLPSCVRSRFASPMRIRIQPTKIYADRFGSETLVSGIKF